MKNVLFICIVALLMIVVGCTDAQIASLNTSRAADSFEVYRRVVFYDGINAEYMLSIEGYLSIEDEGNQLEVTVKDDDGNFLKHFLGLSDNVTYFVEQLQPVNVSDARYRVIFKPSVILPEIDVQ